MYRSWAYILMILATLVGVVALVWPSPQVQHIEEIATVTRDSAPRAEAPARPAKAVAKTAQPKSKAAVAPAPPAVVTKMPAPNTTTRRAGPLVQNGLQPGMFGNPGDIPAPAPPPSPAARTSTAAPKGNSSVQPRTSGAGSNRPPMPPRPPTAPRSGFGGAPPRPSHNINNQ